MANLGSIIRQGNILRIDNAFVEEVSVSGRNSGYIIISYSVPSQGGVITVDQLRLNVSDNTIIRNSFGAPIRLGDIQRGNWVDVTFSSRMTRSIPPQSNALSIITRPPARPSANVTTGRIIWVDVNNNQILTGMPNDFNSMIRFQITNQTIIQNRSGFPISIRALRPGQLVRITHANFQTLSIPPQTTAFRIQVI